MRLFRNRYRLRLASVGIVFMCVAATSSVAQSWSFIDDFRISKGVRFTMLKSDRRYVSVGDTDRTVTFERAAPAAAWLRFAAIGSIQVSFDGAPFVPAVRQDGSLQVAGNHHPEHFSNYWMPIPEGTEQVTFAFAPDVWFQSDFLAKDIAIWSLATGGTGCAGTGGVVPKLTHDAPTLGNATFGFDLIDARPMSAGVVAVSLEEVVGADCDILVGTSPQVLLVPNPAILGPNVGFVGTDAAGTARLSLPLPASPFLDGLLLFAQGLVVDPAGMLAIGNVNLATTPLRRLVLGF